jgi:glycosyltransferase involved in cell wall biosynthesis
MIDVDGVVGGPLVSVLMPCYKSAEFVGSAIESCLVQTYGNFELICVDDKSPDGLLEILRSYERRDTRVRVIERERNGGIAEAFQTGLDHARGELVTRLASDDLFYPTALELLVDALHQNPEVSLVYGDMMQVDERGTELYRIVTEEPERALLPRNRVGLYVMWRRAVHRTVGGFECTFAEDYYMWLKISLDYELLKVEGPPGVGFRFHSGQTSNSHKAVYLAATRAHWMYHRLRSRKDPLSLEPRVKALKARLRILLCQMGIIKTSGFSLPDKS